MFEDCTIEESSFIKATLQCGITNSTFTICKFIDATLTNCVTNGTTFDTCDLRNTTFTNNTYSKTKFIDCLVDYQFALQLKELAENPGDIIFQRGMDQTTNQLIFKITVTTR